MKKRFGFKRGFCLVVLGAILMAVLPGVPGVGSAAGKGKPPKEPVTRFQVEYVTDPFSFNILPDGEGLFGGGGCSPDCYVDGINDSVIFEQDGLFKQLQERDLVLREIYSGIYDAPHYRHFETDIEFQAIEGNEGLGLCPELIDRTSDWTLGGGYDAADERFQKVLFSLWVDVWPDAGQAPSWSTGWARVKGAVPIADPPVFGDFDADGEPEELLRGTSPTWELVWDDQEHPGTGVLDIAPSLIDGTFRVESLGQAMLRVKRPGGNGGKGRYRNCGLVYARFAVVATAVVE